MPEVIPDPLLPPCYLLLSLLGIEEFQQLAPDPSLRRARDARGRFAKGSSGNQAAGRAAFPTPGGACRILWPGR